MKGLRDFALVFALAAICGTFWALSPQFLSPRNLSMLMIELSVTATLALGMLLVILPGHIDLSAGSGVGLIGGVASVLVFHGHWPAPLALGAGLALGVLVWGLMGTLIVRQSMPSFIITLGGLLIFKGLFWLVIANRTVPVTAGAEGNLYSLLTTYYLPGWAGILLALICTGAAVRLALGARARRREHGLPEEKGGGEDLFLKLFLTAQLLVLFVIVMNQFRGVPLPVVLLGIVAAAVWLLTRHTPFGRYLYAIGGNQEAAVLSGIPVERVLVAAYALLGGIVAITGFMQTAYSGASTTTVGELMELDAIAACVIGGASLKGGRGTALGVLLGALIMAALLNGMTLLAVSPEIKLIARGTVLALAVWMDVSTRGENS